MIEQTREQDETELRRRVEGLKAEYNASEAKAGGCEYKMWLELKLLNRESELLKTKKRVERMEKAVIADNRLRELVCEYFDQIDGRTPVENSMLILAKRVDSLLTTTKAGG